MPLLTMLPLWSMPSTMLLLLTTLLLPTTPPRCTPTRSPPTPTITPSPTTTPTLTSTPPRPVMAQEMLKAPTLWHSLTAGSSTSTTTWTTTPATSPRSPTMAPPPTPPLWPTLSLWLPLSITARLCICQLYLLDADVSQSVRQLVSLSQLGQRGASASPPSWM